MVRAKIIAILLSGILLLSTTSAADFLTTPPYVQSVFSDSAAVCFIAEVPTQSFVNYGTSTSLGNTAATIVEEIHALWGNHYIPSEDYSDITRYSHCAYLFGLQPETTYYYQAEIGSQESSMGTFTTAPTGTFPFTFAVYGDSRSDPWGRGVPNSAHEEVINAMKDYEFDFVVNTGDFVHDGFDIRLWETNIPITSPVSMNRALYIAIGNHEDRDEGSADGRVMFEQIFAFPGDTSGRETYYSFDYSNCHFIFVTSEENFKPGSVQYDWIVNDLSQARADKNTDFIFAFLHRPPFSCVLHGGPQNDDTEQEVQDYLVPVFEQYGVDVAFFGHEHSYERSEKEGVVYIIQGNGGAWPAMLGSLDHNPYGIVCEPNFDRKHFGFGLVQVNGDYLKFESVITSGEVIDTFEIGTPPEPDDDTDDDIDDDTSDDDASDDDSGGDDDDDEGGCGCSMSK